jgi:hypothetical protein
MTFSWTQNGFRNHYSFEIKKVKRDRVRRQSSKKQILRKKRGNSLNLKNIKRRVEMLDAVSTELYPSAAASGARQQQKDPKNNKKH